MVAQRRSVHVAMPESKRSVVRPSAPSTRTECTHPKESAPETWWPLSSKGSRSGGATPRKSATLRRCPCFDLCSPRPASTCAKSRLSPKASRVASTASRQANDAAAIRTPARRKARTIRRTSLYK
eukprot:scaffold119326_cov26-Tisochrysis_lutea.AAC.2